MMHGLVPGMAGHAALRPAKGADYGVMILAAGRDRLRCLPGFRADGRAGRA